MTLTDAQRRALWAKRKQARLAGPGRLPRLPRVAQVSHLPLLRPLLELELAADLDPAQRRRAVAAVMTACKDFPITLLRQGATPHIMEHLLGKSGLSQSACLDAALEAGRIVHRAHGYYAFLCVAKRWSRDRPILPPTATGYQRAMIRLNRHLAGGGYLEDALNTHRGEVREGRRSESSDSDQWGGIDGAYQDVEKEYWGEP